MEDDCGCGIEGFGLGPVYDSPEGREKRQTGIRHLRRLCLLQIVLSLFSTIIGLASLGVAAVNPSYPQMNGYAVVSGILVFIGSVLALKASRQSSFDHVSPRVRGFILVHCVTNIICLTFSVLQIVVTCSALVECFSSNQDKCMPYLTANQILDCLIIGAGIGLFISCIIGTVFFFRHARAFGYKHKQKRLSFGDHAAQ